MLQDIIEASDTDKHAAADVFEVLLHIPDRLGLELCSSGATSPEATDLTSSWGVGRALALGEEARGFYLVRRENIDGQEVSEAMVRSCQVVKDRVIGGPEVASKQINKEFIPSHGVKMLDCLSCCTMRRRWGVFVILLGS